MINNYLKKTNSESIRNNYAIFIYLLSFSFRTYKDNILNQRLIQPHGDC